MPAWCSGWGSQKLNRLITFSSFGRFDPPQSWTHQPPRSSYAHHEILDTFEEHDWPKLRHWGAEQFLEIFWLRKFNVFWSSKALKKLFIRPIQFSSFKKSFKETTEEVGIDGRKTWFDSSRNPLMGQFRCFDLALGKMERQARTSISLLKTWWISIPGFIGPLTQLVSELF